MAIKGLLHKKMEIEECLSMIDNFPCQLEGTVPLSTTTRCGGSSRPLVFGNGGAKIHANPRRFNKFRWRHDYLAVRNTTETISGAWRMLRNPVFSPSHTHREQKKNEESTKSKESLCTRDRESWISLCSLRFALTVSYRKCGEETYLCQKAIVMCIWIATDKSRRGHLCKILLKPV